jgi:uncharacterized membrane protein
MEFKVEIPLWALSLSYWVHLLATVIWLGGLVLMALIAWPAVRRQMLDLEQWAELRMRFTPLANGSLALLWVTGFLQMAADDNYQGFLAFDNTWARAIVIKHIAVIGMIGLGVIIQGRIYPALNRLAMLQKKQPEMAAAERARLAEREMRLVRLNLILAAAVLLCTAVATAV